jgi:hypothetical protein
VEVTLTIETTSVRFRRPFQGYKAGQIVEVPKGQARAMQMMGRVDLVEQPLLEVAVAPEPVVEQAVAPKAKAPRRRRRAKK